jgi:hypothetical protein
MRAYFFQHLDSRGGSTLIARNNIREVQEMYLRAFQPESKEEAEEILKEDYVGAREVTFIGPEPTNDEEELLLDYDGDYHAMESDNRFIFIHKSVLPENASLEEKIEMVEEEVGGNPKEAELGEDAFGCMWMT